MTSDSLRLLDAFEARELCASQFGHREHVEVAYEMLRKYGFLEAAWRYSRGIATLATRVGAPEKFNVTVTLAFLSLIAERIFHTQPANCSMFLTDNQDLLRGDVLHTWYSVDQLDSKFAKSHFLMPTP